MTSTTLPAVRIPPATPGQGGGEDSLVQDAVIVDLPPSNKFAFAWPTEQQGSVALPLVADRPPVLSSSDGETDVSEEESSAPMRKQPRPESLGNDSEFVTPTNHLNSEQNPMDQVTLAPAAPRLSRAFSMPLRAQLGSLQHPRRASMSFDPSSPLMVDPPAQLEQFRELSLELADSVQMVIQTLLQLSPPQLLDPAKEQFSACSLSIPTPSISAMFTSMKNLNYMSANMSALSQEIGYSSEGASGTPKRAAHSISKIQSDFDIGELLQSVGDVLSGVAAHANVELVLFHGDVGMKHVAVKGDESGLSYTLAHVIRQVIGTSGQGDTVEIGLYIETVAENAAPREGDLSPVQSSSGPGEDIQLRCNFLITHKFTGGDFSSSDSLFAATLPAPDFHRPVPMFDTLILRRLLRHINASLTVDPATRDHASSRSYEMTIVLGPGEPSVVNPEVSMSSEEASILGHPDMHIADEPSLEELLQFAETLRGKGVILHANSKGSFAHHLSSYLTAWGMDVSHMSTEPDANGEYELVGEVSEPSAPPLPVIDPQTSAIAETPPSISLAATRPKGSDAAFILIDDDVGVLRSRLQKIKAEQAYPLHIQARKRPSLATHHRPRSSPQVARVMGITNSNPNPPPAPSVVIVHFTSLSQFKSVKDVIQTLLAPAQGSSIRIPEVIVIPKPAGPRRFLTALHTAITHPVVDPFFVPTATSPMSPGLHSISPFFVGAPKSPGNRSSTSTRAGSDRSTKSPKDFFADSMTAHAPPSPLGQPDNMEYFSDAAVKLGTSPATGLLIQSPDGQPTGIFFHPKPRVGPLPPTPNMERERAQEGREVIVRQRPFVHVSSVSENRSLTASSFAISPPVMRASPRPAFQEISEVVPPSLKAKGRQASGSIIEDMPPQGIEQSFASVGLVSPDLAQQQGSPRFVGRRGSIPGKDSASSPPSSPQVPPAAKPSTIRRTTKRPVADSAASKKGKTGPDGNIVPPISVLIVDDNPINQTILSTFMKKKKIKFDVAKNGEEAVHKWRSGVFHLILMDIQMPVMDGIQATKEIRRIEKQSGGGFPSTPQSEGQRTPSDGSTSSEMRAMSTPPYRSSVIIVALTASSLQADRVAALAAGCNDFLTKPVSLQWLNSKIIEWGSIKALQMWADIRPEVVRSISSGQTAQAQHVARRLHVPEGRSTTPSGERSRGMSMAGRRGSAEHANAHPAERSNTQSTHSEDSPGGIDPPRGSISASSHLSPAFTGMTASEAALGLAAAHRPQAPSDGARSPADIAQVVVIPATPEAAVPTTPNTTVADPVVEHPPTLAPKESPRDETSSADRFTSPSPP